MPADGFYGDMDGDWHLERDPINRPSYMPSAIELMVGRVDYVAAYRVALAMASARRSVEVIDTANHQLDSRRHVAGSINWIPLQVPVPIHIPIESIGRHWTRSVCIIF